MHHPFGIDQLQLYRKMSFERDLLRDSMYFYLMFI
jgi:hypothetical protein